MFSRSDTPVLLSIRPCSSVAGEVCYDHYVKETLRAVFENGVFRPLKRPKGLAERREVMLTVTVEEGPSSLADFAGAPSVHRPAADR